MQIYHELHQTDGELHRARGVGVPSPAHFSRTHVHAARSSSYYTHAQCCASAERAREPEFQPMKTVELSSTCKSAASCINVSEVI